jgi:hypothetical protein
VFDLVEELFRQLVEQDWLFEVGDVPGSWKYREPASGQRSLEHQICLEDAVVLVAGDDQYRDIECRQFIVHRVQRGSRHLHATNGQRGSYRAMFAKQLQVFVVAVGILVLVLDPGRPESVPLSDAS